jgi:hypothetical protein
MILRFIVFCWSKENSDGRVFKPQSGKEVGKTRGKRGRTSLSVGILGFQDEFTSTQIIRRRVQSEKDDTFSYFDAGWIGFFDPYGGAHGRDA